MEQTGKLAKDREMQQPIREEELKAMEETRIAELEAVETEVDVETEESRKIVAELAKVHISPRDHAAEGRMELQEPQGEASVRMDATEEQNKELREENEKLSGELTSEEPAVEVPLEEETCTKDMKEHPKMLRLISEDGHVFIVTEELAFVSPTIVAMMSGPAMANGECHLTRIPSHLLSILVRYLYYKKINSSASPRASPLPSFAVTSSLRADVTYAADFLGLISDYGSLWEAVDANDLLSVCALLCKGRASLEESQQGTTPLFLAADKGYADIAEELLRAGASVTSPQFGYSAFHLACASNHVAVVRHLIAHGADVNGRDRWGSTPVLFATRGDVDLVRCLLEAGANPRLTNEHGYNALAIARDPMDARPAIIRLLEEHLARHNNL